MPHPGRLRLRAAPDEFLQLADEWSTKLNDFATSLDAVPEPDGEFVRDKYAEQEFTLVGGDGVLAQITALGRLRADYENQSHTWSGSEATNPYHPLIADIDDVLMPLLEAHDDRAKLRRIVSGFPRMAPLANFEDPRLWYVLYDDPGDEQAPTLRIVDPSRSRLVTELEELAADALITGPRRAERQVPMPLLRRLIERSVVVTQDDFRPTLSAAILRLARGRRHGGDRRPDRRARAPHARDARPAHPPARRLARQPGRRTPGPEAKADARRRPGGCLRLGRQPRARRRRRPTPRASSTHRPWPTPPPQPSCAARGARSRPTPAPPRSRSTSPPSACAARSGSSRASATGRSWGRWWAPASSGGSTTRCSTAISRTCAARC